MAFCSSCGAQLPEGARFCPACGATVAGSAAPAAPPPHATDPVRRPDAPFTPRAAGGGARLILPVVVVIAVVVIAFVLWSQRDGTRPIAGEPSASSARTQSAGRAGFDDEAAQRRGTAAASDSSRSDPFVTAASLDSAFFDDPAAAAARYDGPVRVSGTIATMVTPGPVPALSLEGRTRFNYLIANFPTGYRERLAPLAKGQRIAIACERVSALGGTTILHDCALAE